PTRSGSRSATATSSRRCSPTPSGWRSTTSSGSTSTRRRSRWWCAVASARSCSASTRWPAISGGCVARRRTPPSAARRAGRPTPRRRDRPSPTATAVTSMVPMAPTVHGFDWPDRFVTGTLGEPGSRTFYLQAQEGKRLLSVALEKQQSAALADGVDTVLDRLMAEDGNPFGIPESAPEGLEDDDPLAEPVEERFRVGEMRLGWDATTSQVVIEALPLPLPLDEDGEVVDAEPEEVLVVRLPVGAARAFAARTRSVVAQGRPICP